MSTPEETAAAALAALTGENCPRIRAAETAAAGNAGNHFARMVQVLSPVTQENLKAIAAAAPAYDAIGQQMIEAGNIAPDTTKANLYKAVAAICP